MIENNMKSKEEIKAKIKEFELKLMETTSYQESNIIKTKIYSLQWVIGEFG